DKGNHIRDMLLDRIGVATAVPMVGKEMPQADRDHAVFSAERPQHRRPDAKIAERAVHADQWRASLGFANLEIGHVIAVDAERLHFLGTRRGPVKREAGCGAGAARSKSFGTV